MCSWLLLMSMELLADQLQAHCRNATNMLPDTKGESVLLSAIAFDEN